MNRLTLALAGTLLLAPAIRAESAGLSGTWTASIDAARPQQIQLSTHFGHSEHDGSRFALQDFTGLAAGQMRSVTRVPVQFEMRRDAGTIAFEGTFRDGEGAGAFTFEPHREFPGVLRGLGVDFAPKRGDEDHELYMLTIFGVSAAYIRSMQAVGYKVGLDEYEQFRIFDVDPAYVRDMTACGFAHLDADKIVETRIHGATPDYIRAMRAQGTDLPLDGYIESRIFNVTPEYADEMAKLGYPHLDHDELVQFRTQDVSPAFVRDLRDLGYRDIPAEKLVEMRIHGVTPEFIRRVGKAGYTRVPVDKLIQMRIFNIEPEIVKALDTTSH